MYVDLVIVSEWHLFKQTDGLILNQNSSSLAWYGCTIIAKMWIFLFFPPKNWDQWFLQCAVSRNVITDKIQDCNMLCWKELSCTLVAPDANFFMLHTFIETPTFRTDKRLNSFRCSVFALWAGTSWGLQDFRIVSLSSSSFKQKPFPQKRMGFLSDLINLYHNLSRN